jgi:hypothetical protein
MAISCSRSTAVFAWGIDVLETAAFETTGDANAGAPVAGAPVAGAEETIGAAATRDGATLAGDSSRVPHIPQKRNFSELSSPHLEHLTIVLLRFGVAFPHYR